MSSIRISIGEGFDFSGLTVLVMATRVTFKGRLTQVVGRILRPSEGKNPLVIDFMDARVSVLRYRARQRWK